MKKYLLFFLLACISLQACKEDDMLGQYGTDKTPPGTISSPAVKNVAGGAIITYRIPEDDDLLYVMATYTRNGQTVQQKASVYDNQLVVEGLGKSQAQDVKMVAYDRSNNASAPVVVTIHPLDAPIYAVLNSIKVQRDFGGIRVDWENPLASNIILTVLTKKEQYGVETFFEEKFYTSLKAGRGNVRGYIDEDREFGVYVQDRWGNVTDTIFNVYKPIYEVALNKSLFRRWNPTGIPYSAYTTANWFIENLWDGEVDLPPALGTGFANFGLQFTFDMGQVAKISRFKINQRPDPQLIYNYAHIKRFQLWGSTHPNVNADFATWVYLGEFESIKPSNRPLNDVTDEDFQYAHVKGEEWDMPLDAPPVRYIRFVGLETWGKANDVQMMELSMWGDTKY